MYHGFDAGADLEPCATEGAACTVRRDASRSRAADLRRFFVKEAAGPDPRPVFVVTCCASDRAGRTADAPSTTVSDDEQEAGRVRRHSRYVGIRRPTRAQGLSPQPVPVLVDEAREPRGVSRRRAQVSDAVS